jgi:hypothetical protein
MGGQEATQPSEGHEPDALHTASLSTGAAGARDREPVNNNSGRAASLLLIRHAPLAAAPRLAALLVALMIVWATLGHRVAASSRFVGEGSAACLLGLAVGLLLVVARRLFHPEVLQGLLSFDPANFV